MLVDGERSRPPAPGQTPWDASRERDASKPVILASASPRRRELLSLLGVPFEVIPSSYEEPAPETHADPARFAVHLALEKAGSVAADHRGRVVVGADTIVALGNRLLAKPRDVDDAVRILTELSGQVHQVITGVAVGCMRDDKGFVSFHRTTEVVFRKLTEGEIRAYVATGEPMDKAGAYGIQGVGGLLIEGIRGDYPNVVGLPITPLAQALRSFGYTVLGQGG